MQERWQQVDAVFQAMLDCAPQDRAGFLETACANDAALRSEVESLLAYHEQADSFMETPALGGGLQPLPDDRIDSMPGRRIGTYEIISEIRHGGVGAVYLAARADDQYQKKVAIKLVKRGMNSGLILSHFRIERQILANLDHPNIAKLLDGGATEEGLPYFVMEYIEGLPIDGYCEQHHLSVDERLALFRTVCAAVHYAHQNLVVHRDIKPGNILVSAKGTAKLLDLGIAKILNPNPGGDAAAATATIQGMMTPGYASPEQVRGELITTASDTYSLGVLLYELLSGQKPYRVATNHAGEIARVICETEPVKPSAAVSGNSEKLRRRLRGDLDNIALMALRKEPQRRYGSAEQFSEDIRRHLAGLPVLARKDTLAYRAGKFIERNTAAVAAASLFTALILAGIATTVWEARVARSERARAERRFEDVRNLANSYLFEFHDAIANLPGSTPARELLVKRALEYLDRLIPDSSNSPALQHELAVAYRKVGDVQGEPYNFNLGDTAGALRSYRKSIAILESLPPEELNKNPGQLDLSSAYQKMTVLLIRTRDTGGALDYGRKALEVRRRLSGSEPENAEYRRLLGESLVGAGDGFLYSARQIEALNLYRESLKLRQELSAAAPGDRQILRDLTESYQRIGFCYDQFSSLRRRIGDAQGERENYTQSLEYHQQGLKAAQMLSSMEPLNTAFRREVSDHSNQVARVLTQLRNPKEAIRLYEQSRAILEDLSRTDPRNAELKFEIDTIDKLSAINYARTGRAAEGERKLRQAAEHFRSQWLADRTNVEVVIHLIETHYFQGEFYEELANTPAAIESFHTGMKIAGELLSADPDNETWLSTFNRIGGKFAKYLVRIGRAEEASQLTRRMLSLRKEQIDRGLAGASQLQDYADMLLQCEPAGLRDPAAALKYAQKTAELHKTENLAVLNLLMKAYYVNADRKAAVETARKARALVEGSPDTRDASIILAELDSIFSGTMSPARLCRAM